MNAKCNNTLRRIAEELEAQAKRKSKPAEFITVQGYHAILWDGTSAAADVIRHHRIYCELGPLDTCVVCDNKMSGAVWLKHGYWVVLCDDSIIACNLPDDVFRARYNVLCE